MVAILFSYIFGFSIFGSFTSRDILALIFGVIYIFDNQFRSIFHNLLYNKKILKIVFMIVGILVYAIVLTTILKAYDYSLIQKFISLLLNCVLGIFVFALYKRRNCFEKIIDDIVMIFIIQALIQLSSFISPTIKTFFDIFRDEGTILLTQSYDGMRGLSIAGSNFFGLGISYGLIYILYFNYQNKLFLSNFAIKIITMSLLLFAGLSAARTAIIGFGFGLGYYILKRRIRLARRLVLPKISIKNLIIWMVLFILVVSLVYVFLDNETPIVKFYNYLRFAFEYVFNYLETGQLNTRSTDYLFNNMYFKIPISTFIFGDGYYTGSDGSYYMHTDAGYMRNILYFGIIGLLLLFILQINMLNWKREDRFFSTTILVYILVIHIKGDVLGYSTMIQNILLLVLLQKMELVDNFYISNTRYVKGYHGT